MVQIKGHQKSLGQHPIMEITHSIYPVCQYKTVFAPELQEERGSRSPEASGRVKTVQSHHCENTNILLSSQHITTILCIILV